MKNKKNIGMLVGMLVIFATLSSVAGTMNSSKNFEREASNFQDIEIEKNVDLYNEDELVSAERGSVSVNVTDLGAGFIPHGMNDLGQVVGELNDEAVLWSEGSIEVIETPGDDPAHASDINNLGEVVGEYTIDYYGTAFFWDGTLYDLSIYSSWYDPSYGAKAINDAGQIVGSGSGEGTYVCPLMWESYLAPVTGIYLASSEWPMWESNFWAMDINELGDIIGYFYNWDDGSVPWYRQEGSQYGYRFEGDVHHEVTGINDNQQVVGSSHLWESFDAYPFSAGIPTANKINNAGIIVGKSGGEAAIVENGEVYYLNDILPDGSLWVLQDAVDINNVGQVIGTGTYDGEDHGFILTFFDTCPYDVNDDGVVDTLDYGLVTAAFGCDPGDPAFAPYDVNDDGVIDTLDCGLVQAAYGQCTC